MSSPIAVRRAGAADADGIAAVHVRAWRETYAHLLPAEFLAARDPATFAVRWRERIEGGVDVLVAERTERDEREGREGRAEQDERTECTGRDGRTGAILGWANAGPGRDVDAPRALELAGIYVLAEAHGSGAGQALLDAVLGDAAAYLWVAEHNPRAEAFYRRNGFVRDGTTKSERFGGTDLEAVRMVRG